MNKVVYNACYGGFTLSLKAIDWLEANCKDNELREFIKSMRRDKCNSRLKDECFCYNVSNWFEDRRHHKDLVAVVEALGNDANGRCAKLAIATIYCNLYRIDQYDGAESVITPEDTEHWIIID